MIMIKSVVKSSVKLGIFGGLCWYSHSVGIWDPPSDKNKIAQNWSKFKIMASNALGSYSNVSPSLEVFNSPAIETSTAKLSDVATCLKSGSIKSGWGSLVDYSVDSLWLLPDRVRSASTYASSQLKTFSRTIWNELTSEP